MLWAHKRYILHYDFAMTPHPSDAPPLPLDDFVKPLIKRCEDGETVQWIDDDKRVIRLVAARVIKPRGKAGALALLMTLGDSEKADPGFTNVKTGSVRIPPKDKDERPGLSVHVVIASTPIDEGGHLYKMVCEDVTGFGRTLIQRFIRHEFREISSEQGFVFDRPGSEGLKTRPLVELVAHASDTLKNSLKAGRLLNVELIDNVEENWGFDEGNKYIRQVRRDLNLSVSRMLPKGSGLSLVQKLQKWAKAKNYETMRVRWLPENAGKSQTTQLDVASADAAEAMFVKTTEVMLDEPLPDICAEFSEELVRSMTPMVE